MVMHATKQYLGSILLLFFLILTADVIFAQNRVSVMLKHYKAPGRVSVINEAAVDFRPSETVRPLPAKPESENAVSIIPLGASANGLGWGYAGGQRTHLWADDNLKTVALIHRMGPGASPPNLSGYLAVDKAVNMGLTAADWILNQQVYASNRYSGGAYQDEARFPQLGIVNPSGNISTDNLFIAYFAPVQPNSGSWKNYANGRIKWDAGSDSTKHITAFNPPPYHYTPDGFFISQTNKAYVVDLDYNSSTGVYNNNLIVGVGAWNSTSNDFQYTYSSLPLTTYLGTIPLHPRIAADPSGQHVWIACIGNNGESLQVFDSTYFPIFFHSRDAGLTWSQPVALTLDGWNGIPSVTNFISDYRLDSVFGGNVPPREEIAYSTAFDCDLVVDKWGDPHIGVGIHLAAGPFSVYAADSLFAIFDIVGCGKGSLWCARAVGFPKQFRGYFPASLDIVEDNRVNISVNKYGDKVFYTWLDSPDPGDTSNNHPDVFARGYDLILGKLTNSFGKDQGTNVTGSSALSGSAWFADMANIVFTKPDGSANFPIVTETITGDDIVNNPVSFNYLSGFKFTQSDFTISQAGPPWGTPGYCCLTGISENSPKTFGLTAFANPNPARDFTDFSLNIPSPGKVSIDCYSVQGNQVLHKEYQFGKSGQNTVKLDVSSFLAGIYFYTVSLGAQSTSGKLVVK